MSTQPTLLFRADAGPRAGAGHVMRLLALAIAWRAWGGRAVFASHAPAPGIAARIAAHCDAHIELPASWPDSRDLNAVCEAAQGTGARGVVLDGYAFEGGYHRGLRAAGLVSVCIDDLAELPRYEVDVLVNPNPGAEDLPYPAAPGALRLQGARYALLRPGFVKARPAGPRVDARQDGLLQALVTLGGADPENATERVLEGVVQARCFREGRLSLRLLIGADNRRRALLEQQAALAGSQIEVCVDAVDMARLVSQADVAIAAGGVTCLELACAGVPALLVELASNQLRSLNALVRAGAALDLGSHAALAPAGVAVALDGLADDPGRRTQMAERAVELIDGRGAARVAEAVAGRLAARTAVEGRA